MPTSFLRKSSTLVIAFSSLAGLLWGCGDEQRDAQVRPDDAAVSSAPRCEYDTSENPATAAPLATGQDLEAFLCPAEDQDWYEFDTGPNDMLSVSVSMSAAITPVTPIYAIRDANETLVASAPTARAGGVSAIHCVDPGIYLLVVRDAGDLHQDVRNPYTLRIDATPNPDANEPNETREDATALTPEMAHTGYLACADDADWFVFDVPERHLVDIRLEMPIATLQPRLEFFGPDGEPIINKVNRGAPREPTDMLESVAIAEAGTYAIKISDVDGRSADVAAQYTLTVTMAPNTDVNEPNDEPDEATELAEMTFGGDEWTEWVDYEGTFGALGDDDWYRIPVNNGARNHPGLLEVSVTLDTAGLEPAAAWALGERLQAQVAVVLPHAQTPCEGDDGACIELEKQCDGAYDCIGLNQNCLPIGLCAGTGVCLPEGQCGATQVIRRYDPIRTPNTITEAPAANKAVLSAPIAADQEVIYLRVSDRGGDAADADRRYALRIRMRRDPDTYEPSNVYVTDLRGTDGTKNKNTQLATSRNVIPVYACNDFGEGACQPPACDNLRDDDLDGKLDWPADPGCTSWADDDESDADVRALWTVP